MKKLPKDINEVDLSNWSDHDIHIYMKLLCMRNQKREEREKNSSHDKKDYYEAFSDDQADIDPEPPTSDSEEEVEPLVAKSRSQTTKKIQIFF